MKFNILEDVRLYTPGNKLTRPYKDYIEENAQYLKNNDITTFIENAPHYSPSGVTADGIIKFLADTIGLEAVLENTEYLPYAAFRKLDPEQIPDNLVIPANVTYIDFGAFDECIVNSIHIAGSPALKNNLFLTCKVNSVSFAPDSVCDMETSFAHCMAYSIEIPDTPDHTIAYHTCYNLVNVAEIKIHEGIEKIAARAFERSLGLYNIYLPSTLKEIDPDAFADADLSKVTFYGDPDVAALADKLKK